MSDLSTSYEPNSGYVISLRPQLRHDLLATYAVKYGEECRANTGPRNGGDSDVCDDWRRIQKERDDGQHDSLPCHRTECASWLPFAVLGASDRHTSLHHREISKTSMVSLKRPNTRIEPSYSRAEPPLGIRLSGLVGRGFRGSY